MRRFINLNSNSKVYIICPYGAKTGGPEALHQLHFKLRKKNIQSFLLPIEKTFNKAEPSYEKYNPIWLEQPVIEANSSNLVILPEIYTGIIPILLKANVQIIMWWLSVDGYYRTQPVTRLPLEQIFRYNNIVHCVQSHYANHFLLSKGWKEPISLTDYLAKDFISNNEYIEKKDIILVNGRKLSEKASVLLEIIKSNILNIEIIFLNHFSLNELLELYKKAKIYIDLGHHPGRDRTPREAALHDCIIITSTEGSALFFDDIPIPSQYKFDIASNREDFVNLIKVCLSDYSHIIKEFKFYKNSILNQEKIFEIEIENIFGKWLI